MEECVKVCGLQVMHRLWISCSLCSAISVGMLSCVVSTGVRMCCLVLYAVACSDVESSVITLALGTILSYTCHM